MSANRRASDLIRPYFNPAELLDYVRFVADEVAAGRYPIEYDEAQRWHQRIYRDRRVDVWLISWLPSQGTQLHDHGGSAGAFTVLSGELAEAIYRPSVPPRSGRVASAPDSAPALLEQRRMSGSGVGFGAQYVHDVRNLSEEPAVSVHAYSPPLTSMGFYDLDQAGELRKLVSMRTEDPEPVIDLSQLGTPAA
jgi:Cysteine dioxygenase type I